MNDLLIKKRKFIAVYIIWIFINLIILIISDWKTYKFWPFSGSYELMECYDFSEFFVYTIGPLLIFYTYNIFSNKE